MTVTAMKDLGFDERAAQFAGAANAARYYALIRTDSSYANESNPRTA
jgi:hypothetical protein